MGKHVDQQHEHALRTARERYLRSIVCAHYEAVDHGKCAAGVVYRELVQKEVGCVLHLPCFGEPLRRDRPQILACCAHYVPKGD